MLEQAYADSLIKLQKVPTNNLPIDYRAPRIKIPLIGTGSQESFTLDINKASIRLEKHTFHKRIRTSIGLIRVDYSPTTLHTNPDGVRIRGSHVHIYREGYDLQWAYSLPHTCIFGAFTDIGSIFANIDLFYGNCNIVMPEMQGALL